MAISLVPWNHVPALMNNSCSKQRSDPRLISHEIYDFWSMVKSSHLCNIWVNNWGYG